MKKIFSLLILLVCYSSNAAMLQNCGGVFYPTRGVINPSQGTIEITVTPVEALKSNMNDWPFAVLMQGKVNGLTKTNLGIFHPPVKAGEKTGSVVALLWTQKEPVTIADKNSPTKAGVPVNFAITWGSNGAGFYLNGKLIGRNHFPGDLIDMAPYLQVFDVSPFYTSRIKVSAVELLPEQLNACPDRAFQFDPECTLLANDLEHPHFYAAPVFVKKDFVSATPFEDTAKRIVRQSEEITIDFCANNFGEKAVTRDMKIQIDELYQTKAKHTLSHQIHIPAHTIQKIFKVKIGKLPAGYYKVSCSDGNTFNLSVLPDKDRIGNGMLADYIGLSLIRNAKIFQRLDIRWARAWVQHELCWFQVEPTQNHWDFRTADRTINAFRKNGINVLGVLDCPAEWAALRPDITPENQHLFNPAPGGWKPRSIKEWKNYVKVVGTHFKGRVTHYEIWNEVDWHPPKRAEAFSGTTLEYFELLKSASKILHAISPENRVLISGFGTGTPCDENMHRDLIEMGAAKLVDIWNMHAYAGRGIIYRDTIRSVAPQMPIWQTEHMWHCLRDKFRQAYLEPAIHCKYLDMDYTKFFAFGWERYLTDSYTSSPCEPLHSIGVMQTFLRSCDKYLGRIPDLPKNEFDVSYELQRRDGKILSIIGSSCGNYQLRTSESNMKIWDMFGREWKAKNGQIKLKGKLIYVLSDKPLRKLKYQVLMREQLLPNPDFEDLAGDNLAGIDKCRFSSWQISTKNNSMGKIGITENSYSGKYAVELTSLGKDTYVSASLWLPTAGTYRLEGRFKTISGAPRPFIRLFEQKENGWLKNMDFAPVPNDRFVKLHFDVDVKQPSKTAVAAILGITGKGKAVLDKVQMFKFEKLKFKETNAVCIPLPSSKYVYLLQRGKHTIDLDMASPLGVGKKYYAGIPWLLNKNWLVVSGKDWKNSDRQSYLNIKPVIVRNIYLLAGVMYQPSGNGIPLANVELLYEDGSSRKISLRSGGELKDWFLGGHRGTPVVKWESPVNRLEYGLFSCKLVNPQPDKKLRGMKLITTNSGITAIKAITLEKRTSAECTVKPVKIVKSNVVCWAMNGRKVKSSITENGSVVFSVKRNDVAKKNDSSIQCWIDQRIELKAKTKYVFKCKIKVNCNCNIPIYIIETKPPYKHIASKKPNFKKDVLSNVSVPITPAEAISGKYRMPCICLGRLPNGTTAEISEIQLVEVK